MIGIDTLTRIANNQLMLPPTGVAGEATQTRTTMVNTNSLPRKRRHRRRSPLRPGLTAKNNERRFVAHNYHDHANDVDDNPNARRRTNLFPIKLHKVLEEQEIQSIIAWQPHGRCFIIHQPKVFVKDVLPRFFKQSKLTSFQRQLSLYGFQRITRGPDEGGYYHELFLRGKPYLCYRMNRAIVKGTRIKATSNPDQEPNFYAMRPVVSPTSTSTSTSEPNDITNTNILYNRVGNGETQSAFRAPSEGGTGSVLIAPAQPQPSNPINAFASNNNVSAVPVDAFQPQQSFLLRPIEQHQTTQIIPNATSVTPPGVALTPLQQLFAEEPMNLRPGMFSGDFRLADKALYSDGDKSRTDGIVANVVNGMAATIASKSYNNNDMNTVENYNDSSIMVSHNNSPTMRPATASADPSQEACMNIVPNYSWPQESKPSKKESAPFSLQKSNAKQLTQLPSQQSFGSRLPSISLYQQFQQQQQQQCYVSDNSCSGDTTMGGMNDSNTFQQFQQHQNGYFSDKLQDDEPLQRMLDALTEV